MRSILCSKSFRVKGHLQVHINTVHKKLKPYQFQVCSKVFGASGTLQTHISAVHDKLTPYQCTECSKFFAFISVLQIHHNNVHKKVKAESVSSMQQSILRKMNPSEAH